MHQDLSCMHRDLSRGKKLLKTPSYLYFISQRINNKYNAFSILSTTYNCIVYPSTQLTDSSQYLSNFQALQAPISFRCSLRN